MADIGALVEGLGYASESWAGWRFILSNSYRKTVRESWKNKTATQVAIEKFFGLFFMAFSALFIVFVVGTVIG